MTASTRRTSVRFLPLTPTSTNVSFRMRKNVKGGGRAERLLRSTLWRAGLRFRVHARRLPGTPDVVFSAARVCVFCDGDFWHGRNWPRLRRQLMTRNNAVYWVAKILSNRRRDRRTDELLRLAGWDVQRYWETDILRSPGQIAAKIAASVRSRI